VAIFQISPRNKKHEKIVFIWIFWFQFYIPSLVCSSMTHFYLPVRNELQKEEIRRHCFSNLRFVWDRQRLFKSYKMNLASHDRSLNRSCEPKNKEVKRKRTVLVPVISTELKHCKKYARNKQNKQKKK
jgi:hypothetical protein